MHGIKVGSTLMGFPYLISGSFSPPCGLVGLTSVKDIENCDRSGIAIALADCRVKAFRHVGDLEELATLPWTIESLAVEPLRERTSTALWSSLDTLERQQL